MARDRLGIKPLYYALKRGVSSFEFGVSNSKSENAERPSSSLEVGSSKINQPIAEHNTSSELKQVLPQLETRNSKLETTLLETGNSKPETVFIFASEVRTLLASGLVPRRLSRDALESYLLFGSVSEPMTLIEDVYSLPPGHRMTIALDQPAAPLRPERYWNIARTQQSAINPALPATNGNRQSNLTSAQRVRQLLEESVRKHLIADVPAGVFLSSGIDSTALAALASREAAGVHTFTVAFPEKEFSEAEIARRTATKFGTTHQELMLSGDEMLARVSDAVSALDQPSMDGINTYFVSWGARQAGLKVALSGLGGDEIFGGYSTFRRTAKFQRLAAIGGSVPRGVRAAMASAVAETGGRCVSRDAAQKLAALWDGGAQSLPDAFFFGRNLFTPAQVAKLQRDQKRNGTPALWRTWLTETAKEANELDMFGAVTCMEARSYLVNTLLRDTDSMSMAHSLEVRVPFLNHPLVEFVTHLPQAAKLKNGIPKALLVEALSDVLPTEVVNQTKRGFTFPWAEWLRGPLKNKVERGLSELSPSLNEVLDAKETRRVWQDYLDGNTSWSRPWSLYVLNEWAKRNIDERPSAEY